MKTPPPYDHENLTPAQWASLIALSIPLAAAIRAGVPTDAILEHVSSVLANAKSRVPGVQ